MSLIVKIFLIEDWSKEPTQIRRFAWDTGLRFPELCEKVLNLYPDLIGRDLVLKWKDEEGDWIDISSDTELLDAVCARDGQLLKLWVSAEKKPSEPKCSCGCRKGFSSCKEHKMAHLGYVCDVCPGYDSCLGCFDKNAFPGHSLVEIRFLKRGRCGCSRETEKEFIESASNEVAKLPPPLYTNVDVEVAERPTQPSEDVAF